MTTIRSRQAPVLVGSNILPSVHQIGDAVLVENIFGSKVKSKIMAVKFTASKVFYDIEVSGHIGIVEDVDSSIITKP